MFEIMNSVFITSIQYASQLIELLAIIIIVGAVILGTGHYLWSFIYKQTESVSCYSRYKEGLGKSLF